MTTYSYSSVKTVPSSSAANGVSSDAHTAEPVTLTRREVEVLTLVIEGKSSKEIADELFVSKRTVDFHLANIFQKLNVSNRFQAFREATRRGLITFSVGNGAAAGRELAPA